MTTKSGEIVDQISKSVFVQKYKHYRFVFLIETYVPIKRKKQERPGAQQDARLFPVNGGVSM